MNFLEIQSWTEIPSIGHFVSLFSSSFNLPDFDIEDLEEALLLDSSDNNSIDDSATAELAPRLIPDLIVSLLRGCDLVKSWPNITTSNYQMFLRRLLRNKCEEYNIENPFNTDTDFHSLSLRTKAVILHYLCEFRLDSVDVESITSGFEADSLRIEPLGFDSNDSAYWYFYGTRLYREDLRKSSKKGATDRIWQVICFTEQDWENLANKFKHSKSRKESALYKILAEDFLPQIPALFKAKEAERRRRLFQRRSSLRVKGLVERQKAKQGEDSGRSPSEEDSDSKLSYSEKYLERKKRQTIEKSKIQEKVQLDRALRAQRRSPSLSSSLSVQSSCEQGSPYNFENFVDENFHLLNERNENLCLSNKENILHSSLVVNNLKSINTKMPPTSTKLPGRQTNNSLSSITGQIVIQSPSTQSAGTSNSRKKKVKAEVFMETDEVLQIGMHKVLQHLKNHDDAWPFMDPVEEDIAPRYYSIIKRPMDLLKMEEKLDNGEYRSFAEFRTDFKLIVNNCRLYNGQNNEYTEMVNNLQQAFDRSSKKYFDQTSSDEEPVLLEYPPIEPTNTKHISIKEKEIKTEKSKTKEKKHSKSGAKISTDNEEKCEEKTKHKKKDSKNKTSDINIKKTEKKSVSANISDKKKEKSTKGVKRKHKDKDKSDKTKSKKFKKDLSEDDVDAFTFDEEKCDEYDIGNDVEIGKNDNVLDSKKKKSGTKVEKKLNKNDKDPKRKNKKSDPISKLVAKKQTKVEIPSKVEVSPKRSKKGFKKNEKNSTNRQTTKQKNDEMDSDSDMDSVHDLIDEKNVSVSQKNDLKEENAKKRGVKASNKNPKVSKKGVSKPSTRKPDSKTKLEQDLFSLSSASFSRSPSPLPSINSSADDLNNSFDTDRNSSLSSSKKIDMSFRSDTPEIKDKFDLIKERRNKMNQDKEKAQKSDSQQSREKNQKLKDTIEKLKIKNEKSKSQLELFDEVLGGKSVKKDNLFDKLKNEDFLKPKTSGKEKEAQNEIQGKSKKPKVEEKTKQKDGDKVTSSQKIQNITNKKQNKACLDVLDMETEQTLKDINKWLEHTPRFEYSSASNSPSRYIIDEIDMPSKMDDNDFRKPIPLMPSSPSASHSNFQSPPKDFNLLKESNNNKQSSSSQPPSVASTSNKKISSKEPKRKSLKEKLQQLPRKKEVQRTIDRLQPGKTKGNLLHNIQNINKPEELFPLGNREKTKEVKNSLIVQTDESSPKLSLGSVLDTQSFNFSNSDDNKKPESERFDDPSLKIDEEIDNKISDEASSKIDIGHKLPTEFKKEDQDIHSLPADKQKPSENATKPNLNAWFKAFGGPKKPKKSESHEEAGKSSDNNEMQKIEGNCMPTHHRRLSTGSSMSERSSIEDSPQVGLDERLGAPAPYPSPIGASPIMASPKTEETQKNYPVNGSIGRVGFYQDMASTKSSPEKSCSPREMPSPYGQYSQTHLYSTAGSASSSGMYGNFYNPDNTSTKHGQVSYSKPTTSPASYYDQYKQPLSQESEFNNSMSPSTNPNSPYHSQQSSPYQQQPNSPFQSPASVGSNPGTNPTNPSQTPNSSYSQPNSPYQQPQSQTTSFHHSSSSSSSTSPQNQKSTQNQASSFNNQSTSFPHIESNVPFNQQLQTLDTFPQSSQICPKPSDWANKANSIDSNSVYGQQESNNFKNQNQSIPSQSSTVLSAPNQQHILASDNSFSHRQGSFNKKPNEQSSGTPSTTPLYGTNKLPEISGSVYNNMDVPTKPATKEGTLPANKQADEIKYLDLSKQQTNHLNQQQANQYQHMFDLSNYSKSSLDFDISKSKSMEMFNRSLQKGTPPMSAASCAGAQGFWGNSNKPPDTANYTSGQNEGGKIDLTGKSALNNILNSTPGNNFLNNSHQQASRNPQQAVPLDINYKQPLFNSPTSSMMDLTAFMRDFRQAEERFSTFSGATGSFYEKSITPAHMFGKNLQQANTSATLQQMFNSSMTTMAYNREQQNMNLSTYHNRLNPPQPAVNTNQAHSTMNPQIPEVKTKKSRKKKNASPEEIASNSQSQNQQIQQHHQSQSHPHSQHQQLQQHQQLAHQQSFQSYSGLKIPSAAAGADPSAISLKSVVPGSAFNYGPTPLTGLYGESPSYLDELRGTPNPYYPPPGLGHRSTPDPTMDKTSTNPPPAHPQAPSSPYHHLLPPHHASRSSYPFMNSIDPAALQQQYRMMLNQTYQAGYHPALGMHNQPPHWPHM